MSINHYEQEYDDQVYEDDYYDEHYEDEELVDDNDIVDSEDKDAGHDWETEKKVPISFACDDCDYRWYDVIIRHRDDPEADEEMTDVICPMCGSMNVTQI